jgi:threonyl-tRNA synthetase
MAVYIEHTAGAFPLWLAPEQIRIAPINDTKVVSDYADHLREHFEKAGLRVGVDLSAESVGKKIRAAGLAKVPYTLVIGEKESKSGKVSPRLRQGYGEFDGEIDVAEFTAKLQQEMTERAIKSRL